MHRNSYDFDFFLPQWSHGDGEGAGGDGGAAGTFQQGAGQDPESGTSGEDQGGSTDLDSKIQAAVLQATQGLKHNRDQILAEKKALAEKLMGVQSIFDSLGGEDGIKQLQTMRESLQKDELGKLLAEGKHDEWFDKRTAALRGDFDQRLQAKDEEVIKLTAALETAQNNLAKTLLRIEVDAAAVQAKVEDSALVSGDVHLAAAQVFTYDEDLDRHVIKDETGVVLLGKDGQNPKTVLEWIEEQKGPRRHWFGASQGAGANGAMGNGSAGQPTDMRAVGRMSMTDYKKYRTSQGLGGKRHLIPG